MGLTIGPHVFMTRAIVPGCKWAIVARLKFLQLRRGDIPICIKEMCKDYWDGLGYVVSNWVVYSC
eukprot:8660278-Ditylum_brightwellii.AAC.1